MEIGGTRTLRMNFSQCLWVIMAQSLPLNFSWLCSRALVGQCSAYKSNAKGQLSMTSVQPESQIGQQGCPGLSPGALQRLWVADGRGMTSHPRSASHQIHYIVDVELSSLTLVQTPLEPHTLSFGCPGSIPPQRSKFISVFCFISNGEFLSYSSNNLLCDPGQTVSFITVLWRQPQPLPSTIELESAILQPTNESIIPSILSETFLKYLSDWNCNICAPYFTRLSRGLVKLIHAEVHQKSWNYSTTSK